VIKLTITGRDVTDALCTVELTGPHITAAAETAFSDWLRERGYIVRKDDDTWETPGELATRLGISSKHICRRRSNPACPAHETVKGEHGRVLYIRPNHKLDAFLTRHLKPLNQN
jgi:hypothetical protein